MEIDRNGTADLKGLLEAIDERCNNPNAILQTEQELKEINLASGSPWNR